MGKYFKNSKQLLGVLFIGVLLGTSCMKEALNEIDNFNSDVEWNPAFALPILNADLTFDNLISKLESSSIKKSGDTLKLVYDTDLFSAKASDLLAVPNLTVPKQSASLNAAAIAVYHANGNAPLPFPPVKVAFAFPYLAEINHIEFKGGSFNLNLSSTFKDSIDLTINIPNLKDNNGLVFNKKITLNYNANNHSVPINKNPVFDLAGYKLDLTGGNPNEFTLNISGKMNYLGNNTSPSDSISVSASFTSLKYGFMDGYMGQIPLALPSDSIQLTIFNNAYLGAVTFAKPRIDFNINSSFGLPIKIKFDKLDAYLSNNQALPIASIDSTILGPVNRNAPPKLTSFILKTPSAGGVPNNLQGVLAQKPKKIVYAIQASTNPAGLVKTNFITDTSTLRVNLHTELPMFGRLNNLVIQDTFPSTGMPTGKTLDKIDFARFKIISTNKFPVDVKLQIYFTDSTYKKLDSLIVGSPNVLSSAVPIANNQFLASEKTTYSQVVQERMRTISSAKYMLVKGVLTSYNSGNQDVLFPSTTRLGLS